MKKIVLFFNDSGSSDNITNIIKKFKNQIQWYFFTYKSSPAYKLAKNKSLENILIDMSLAHIWDQSGVVALEQIIRKFQNGGSKVEIVGLNKESLNLFERLGGMERAH